MILVKTAWNIFRKNIVMNLFTILQMIAVLVMIAVMVSSTCIRYQYYTLFEKYFHSKGIFVKYDTYANLNPGKSAFTDMINNEELKNELSNANDVLACHGVMAYDNENPDNTFLSLSYDDAIITAFTPELQKGRWLKTGKETDVIETVVSENAYGWNVGDTIEIYFPNFPDAIPASVQIVGMLKENAKIPGGYIASEGEKDFNDFYYPYSYEIEQMPALLFSYSTLRNLNTGIPRDSDYDVIQALSSSVIITYPDDVSDDIIEQDISKVLQYSGGYAISLDELNNNSMRYLHRQLYNLLPIILVLFILVSVSSISSSALSTRRRLRDYAVYYINGLQWGHCIWINFVQSVITSVIAVIAAFGVLLCIRFTPFQNQIKIIWNPYLFASMGGIIILYFLISMIMPLIIIGKNTPKQILTK